MQTQIERQFNSDYQRVRTMVLRKEITATQARHWIRQKGIVVGNTAADEMFSPDMVRLWRARAGEDILELPDEEE